MYHTDYTSIYNFTHLPEHFPAIEEDFVSFAKPVASVSIALALTLSPFCR